MPLHLHMPLPISGGCHSEEKGKESGGELLPDLTTGWPSEFDGVQDREGDRRRRDTGKTQAENKEYKDNKSKKGNHVCECGDKPRSFRQKFGQPVFSQTNGWLVSQSFSEAFASYL